MTLDIAAAALGERRTGYPGGRFHRRRSDRSRIPGLNQMMTKCGSLVQRIAGEASMAASKFNSILVPVDIAEPETAGPAIERAVAWRMPRRVASASSTSGRSFP